MKRLMAFAILGLAAACTGGECTNYDFSTKAESTPFGSTVWLFNTTCGPPLDLSDEAGFVRSVNRALQTAGLPPMTEYPQGWVPLCEAIVHFQRRFGLHILQAASSQSIGTCV